MNAVASPPAHTAPIRRRRSVPFLGTVFALAACGTSGAGDGSAAASASARAQESARMKIRIDVDGETAVAVLDDSAAGRDFAALLPLSLRLTDYARIERIADLPRRLSLAGAPDGVAPAAGDLTYYAPWGNLAIFVEGRAYAHGLVRLGRIESGLSLLHKPRPLNVRIERAVE